MSDNTLSPTVAPFQGFPREGLEFLCALEQNNDKLWFDEHRSAYERHLLEPAKAFVNAVGVPLRQFAKDVRAEPRVNGSIFRINRDTRFSKDKTPYKTHLDLWFWEGDGRSWGCSGFFFRLKPDSLILGAGIHQFEGGLLEAYRHAVIDPDAGASLATLVDGLRSRGYDVGGESYKKVPRGFPADHARKQLLLHSGLTASVTRPAPLQAQAASFVDLCAQQFEAMADLHTWLVKLTERAPA